jgi:hypothetical protein
VGTRVVLGVLVICERDCNGVRTKPFGGSPAHLWWQHRYWPSRLPNHQRQLPLLLHMFSRHSCSTCRSLLICLCAHFPTRYQPLLALALRLGRVSSLGRVTSLCLWSSNGGLGFHSTPTRGPNWSLRVRVVASGVAVAGADACRSCSLQSPSLCPTL